MSTLYDYENNDQDSIDKQRVYEACLKGSVEDISVCLENEKHISSYITDGMMPIHVIAVSGRRDAVEILELMLQKGIDVNSRTMGDMDTILHLVVERSDIRHVFPLVLKIMEFEPDLTLRNRSLRTPYDLAIAKGYYELASVLDGSMTSMEAYEFYRQSVGTVYGTKLIRAVLESKEELIIDFTKIGADANILNEHGNGAIHYAITHCTISPLRTLPLLLNAGADANLRDAEGDTALNLAIKSEKLHENGELPKIVDLLLDRGALSTYKDLDGNDAFALAQSRGYNNIIGLLKKKRTQHVQAQTGKQEENDDSSLRKAQTQRESRRIDEEPPTVDDDNRRVEAVSPDEVLEMYLIRAVLEGTADDVQDALGDKNANVKLYDKNGLKIMHHIILRDDGISDNERQKIMKVLIAAGADINAPTRETDTNPRLFCMDNAQYAVCKRFPEHEGRIEIEVSMSAPSVQEKNTPLHLAASVNQICSIEVLLEHKARYQLTNKDQSTPLKVAEYNKQEEARKMLEEHAKKEKQKMVDAGRNSGACAIL